MSTAILTEPRIVTVNVTDDAIVAHLADGRVISVNQGACVEENPLFFLRGPFSRDAPQHSVDTYILIDIGPMNSLAVPDNLPVRTLLCCGVLQSPRPFQRHTDHPPVGKVCNDSVIRHVDRHNPRLSQDCSAHPMPS